MKVFTYGFAYCGFRFGWYKKQLYRLPSKSGVRTYGLKVIPEIMIGTESGYRIKRERMTLSKVKSMTTLFEKPVEIPELKHEDIPY